MADQKEKTHKLRQLSSYLGENMEKFQTANMSVQVQSEIYQKTNQTYQKYEEKIGRSSKLVQLIKNQERYEELWLKISFYVFLATAAYMFFKRFYLYEIIGLVVWAVKLSLGFLQTAVNTLLEWTELSPPVDLNGYYQQIRDALFQFAPEDKTSMEQFIRQQS